MMGGEVGDDTGQALGAQADLGAVGQQQDLVDQQLQQAGLLGWEQLFPQGVEAIQRGADFGGRQIGGDALGAGADLGARSRARTWAITAASISPAATLRTGQDSWPAWIAFMQV